MSLLLMAARAAVNHRITLAITTTTLNIPSSGTGSVTLAATGGTTPYTWSLVSGTLPTGVTLDAAFATNGKLNYDGTQTIGDTNLTFKVADSASQSSTQAVTVHVATGIRWWRINITAVDSSAFSANLAEMEMAASPGGANLCVGGTAFASSQFSATYAASVAFDGDKTTSGACWSSASVGTPHELGYHLGTGSVVNEVRIWNRVGSNGFPPKDFTIQSSTDSTTGLDGTWTDEWSVTGQTGWTSGEERIFTRP